MDEPTRWAVRVEVVDDVRVDVDQQTTAQAAARPPDADGWTGALPPAHGGGGAGGGAGDADGD